MCGIFLFVSRDPQLVDETVDILEPLLKNRGPNCTNRLTIALETKENVVLHVTFVGSVLWLRGGSLLPQPYVDSEGNVLLWNGDVFESEILGDDDSVSDTKLLGDALENASEETLIKVISGVVGPYAFIYYRRQDGQLYFGRDFFGRQSLLIDSSSEHFMLSSVGHESLSRLSEVPATGLFSISLKGLFLPEQTSVKAYPWQGRTPVLGDFRISTHAELHRNVSPINTDTAIRPTEGIGTDPHSLSSLCLQDDFNKNITNLLQVLGQSVKIRLEKMPKYCKNCLDKHEDVECKDAKVGVLFSGGLDSTVLAALADVILPNNEPIDLLNVAFEQPDQSFNVPDRLTAIQALSELKAINPNRKYNLVLINVTREELIVMRPLRIRQLLHPLDTVLDDSIGCAMWYAATGHGMLYGEDCSEKYHSPARVLLLGAGADEQLGGYSRHRVRYQQEGMAGLLSELKKEMDRISERNLGRDNRIVCDHGVSARYPFLDENVVSFLNSLPTGDKCDLRLQRGLGEKLLLRGVAYTLGLRKVAFEPKRAIQFGTRIARMENRKEKATDKAIRTD